MSKQCTVADSYFAEGIGVHSGNLVHVRLDPAPENTGILFIRDDIDAD